MLFIIVATGNHFLLDAVAGGAVVLAGWVAARLLIPAPAQTAPAVQRHSASAHAPQRFERLAA